MYRINATLQMTVPIENPLFKIKSHEWVFRKAQAFKSHVYLNSKYVLNNG